MLSTLLNACFFGSGVDEKHFFPKNPTSYTFNISKNKIKDVITLVFSSEYSAYHPFDMIFNNAGGRFYLGEFKQHNGVETVELIPSSSWISDVYLYKDKPTSLDGFYLLSLTAIDNARTLVSIAPAIEIDDKLKLRAYAGSIPFATHGGARMVEVSSTTIEEYIFLRRIAMYIGVTLPPVNKP